MIQLAALVNEIVLSIMSIRAADPGKKLSISIYKDGKKVPQFHYSL
jgi:hypothetical protein